MHLANQFSISQTQPSLRRLAAVSFLGFSWLAFGLRADGIQDPMLSGFANPPESARPRVWWHWMGGNITEEGIKLDLEWMGRVGLGGFEVIDVNLATPQVVKTRVPYMSSAWQDAFKFATTLGGQMGMEESIASSPGWSETGGPWVHPFQAMKKYVWSETSAEGGIPFSGPLAHPPSNSGAFQNMGIRDPAAGLGVSPPAPEYYADSMVIAYRRPETDVAIDSLCPKVTASGGSPDIAMLSDGDLERTTKLSKPKIGESAWIQFEFSEPETIRSLTIVMKEPNVWAVMRGLDSSPEKCLEASDDGHSFRLVADLPDGGAPEHTVSFPAVKAKFFRVRFRRMPIPINVGSTDRLGFGDLNLAAMGMTVGPPPSDYEIAELVLRPGARVNRFEEKAAFAAISDLYPCATPSFTSSDVVAKSDVVDLTGKMRHDGTLDWRPPAGHWVVLRFGYSLLGMANHPETVEGSGLEVDKLNGAYVRDYMKEYLNGFERIVGSDRMGPRGIRYMTMDSWEAGSQNWTNDMISQFERLRGYSPAPWMPVLTGQIVESAEASDRFLWDFRKTIADLTASEHYGQIEASLRGRGMGLYGESHEAGRAFVADGMEVKKLDDIPMGAMWVQRPDNHAENFDNDADDRESASVAHIYGQNVAAAESMTAATGAWWWSPATLRSTVDSELLNGINRIVIHESTHQPLLDKEPGLALGPFGQWFNRNETWAEEAAPWITYISRSSYLLQQGRFVADLVYFYGEDSNLTAIFQEHAPNVPKGYGFDYINADALIHELHVADGRLATRSGMSYRVLALDSYCRHMSLPVLRAIYKLVGDGAIVAGSKPTDDPSLADDQAEFHRIANELFGDGTGVFRVKKGVVYSGWNLTDVFAALKLVPDFEVTSPNKNTRLQSVHRKMTEGDVYFVANRNNCDEVVEATFRVTGHAPQVWHAETGQAEAVSYKMTDGGCTTVPLRLAPFESVFVVFRKAPKVASFKVAKVSERQLGTIEGPWEVHFQADRGAPSSITFDSLYSWSDNSNKGVKFFSGTATYAKTFNVPDDWLKPGAQLWVDLGDVKNVATVKVNGKLLGVVWNTPYRVDATKFIKRGSNEIVIAVTNSWVNRLIGDQQPDTIKKFTFTTANPYEASSPLPESGLLGPVRILTAE
jgi:hypothetical protein